MAEIGILASVIGIVGAGTKLTLTIFDFAASIGASGRELQNIATEISGLCAVLKQLQSVLEHAHFRPSATAIESAQQLIEQCGKVFAEIDEIVGELRRAKGDELFPSVDFVGKVKWTFSKKSKVLMLRSTLEACKSTLSVMLVTMLLAERVSQRRLSTQSTLVEEEQDKAVTQSLVIAQQCAVEQLEFYEDEVEKELEAEMLLPALTPASSQTSVQTRRRSMGRLVKMFSGLSVVTDLPTPATAPPPLPTRTERASIWLDSILAPPNELQGPHPGKQRQKRMSSVGTENAPLQLLRKWTDQADNLDHKPKTESPIQNHDDDEIWRHAHFSFSSSTSPLANGHTATPADADETPTPGLKKTPTDLISPKTARVQSIGSHLVVGVDGALESSSEVLTKSAHANDSYEAIALGVMAEHGATLDIDDVTLCVSYGGKTKVLKREDKPLEVLRQFEEMELDPRLFIRRVQGSAG
jgi:hypothetical protein